VFEYYHNRVRASNPDEAAMKARDKVMEKFGREVSYLKLKPVVFYYEEDEWEEEEPPERGWFEFYCILV